MYDTVAEADQKLTSTLILYKDEPVIVGGARTRDNRVSLQYRTFGADRFKDAFIDDPSFNMKNLGGKLGYINTFWNGMACTVYSRRIPLRKAHYTQGLSNSNVKISSSEGINRRLGRDIAKRFMTYENAGLKATVQNTFPSLQEIKASALRYEFVEMAFHKFFSVNKEFDGLFKLNYKNQEIGWTSDLEQFNIAREWKYLDELFDENQMKIRS